MHVMQVSSSQQAAVLAAPAAGSLSRCCPSGRIVCRNQLPRLACSTQRIQLPSQHLRTRRRTGLLAAADKASAGVDTAEADAAEEEDTSDGTSSDDVPIEETSEHSPFAELIERARDAIASGEQAAQDSILQEIDTQLTASEAKAQAADAQAAVIQGQVDAAQDKYLRLNADFENFRKRSLAEKTAAVNRAKANVIEELLPVVDAFEAAAGQVKAETEGEQRIAGSYQGLYAKMVDAFKKMGLEVVPGVGTPFDPEVHEAIMRAPSDDMPDGSILQEFRRGFTIGGQLLRPAMVQVSYSEATVEDEAEAIAAKVGDMGAEEAST